LIFLALSKWSKAFDLARLDRQQLRRRACLLERLARLLELDPLDHVGGDDRDLLSLQRLLSHVPSSESSFRVGYRTA
jgi:hypothetical protein